MLNIKASGCCCIIRLIGKNEAINLMQNAVLTKRQRNIIRNKKLLSDLKMLKEILNKFYRSKIPVPLRDVDIERY